MVYSEATIAFPLIAGYAYHKKGWKGRKSRDFSGKLDALNRGAGMAQPKIQKVRAASETGKNKTGRRGKVTV